MNLQKSVRDKLFKKFKKSKLHADKEIHKIARYEVQKLMSYKKKTFFQNRLSDSIVTLKSFGRLQNP